MSQTIYDVTVTKCGGEAQDLLGGGMAVLFGPDAPEFLQDIVFAHTRGELRRTPKAGDCLDVDGRQFRVTKVGDVVAKNLGELGHCTICFGPVGDAGSLPGSLQVEPAEPPAIEVGTRIRLMGKAE